MFSKNVKLKSDTMTKLGERKKLRSHVMANWQAFCDNCIAQQDVEALIPLKDPLYSKKYVVTDKQLVIVYCTTNNPVAIEFDNLLIPTLHSTWTLKCKTPKFVIGAPVIEILCRGASLMGPGVLNRFEIPNFESGEVCFICTSDNPVPVAVALTLMSLEAAKYNDFKGKLANIVHIIGDELHIATKTKMPSPEDFCKQNVANDSSAASPSEKCEHLDKTEDSLNKITPIDPDEPIANHGEGENPAHQIEPEDTNSSTMEDRLQYCLLKGLKMCKNNFPILCSTFQCQYFLPACPVDQTVDVKKSVYKKMSVFYREYETKGLISLFVSDKDVMSIASVNFSHQLFRGFKVSADPISVENVAEEEGSNESFVETFVFPEIKTVYLTSKAFNNVFNDIEKGTCLSASDIRTLFKNYVVENCESSSDGVLLNPELASLLLAKNENKTHLSWQDLNARAVGFLQPAYEIHGGSFTASALVKGKSFPVLKVFTQRRAGNKHVTLIEHVDKFGINPKEFAKFLQNIAASSASVTYDKATKSEYVQVQGNQIKILRRIFLEKLNFPPKFVDIPLK